MPGQLHPQLQLNQFVKNNRNPSQLYSEYYQQQMQYANYFNNIQQINNYQNSQMAN